MSRKTLFLMLVLMIVQGWVVYGRETGDDRGGKIGRMPLREDRDKVSKSQK